MACGSGKVTIQLVDEEAGPGSWEPKPFRGQSYEAIRATCLDEGILFRDPYFPAGPDALGYDQLGPDSEKAKGVKWMRPHVKFGWELCSGSEGGGAGAWAPGSEGGGAGGLGSWVRGRRGHCGTSLVQAQPSWVREGPGKPAPCPRVLGASHCIGGTHYSGAERAGGDSDI